MVSYESEALQNNDELQSEGKRLLEVTGLIELLSTFGQVVVGGSYVYGTVVDRDIDIEVLCPANQINFEVRAELISALAMLPQCITMKMTDRIVVPKEGRPQGIWYAPYLLFEGKTWGIDIWLQPPEEAEVSKTEYPDLDAKMRVLTIEQRVTILGIKHQTVLNGTKVKGVTSVEVYAAVLDRGVTSYKEFMELAVAE
jgi:hypothetical protein